MAGRHQQRRTGGEHVRPCGVRNLSVCVTFDPFPEGTYLLLLFTPGRESSSSCRVPCNTAETPVLSPEGDGRRAETEWSLAAEGARGTEGYEPRDGRDLLVEPRRDRPCSAA